MITLLIWLLFLLSFGMMVYYSIKYQKYKNMFMFRQQTKSYYLSKGLIFTFLTIFLFLLAMILVKVY